MGHDVADIFEIQLHLSPGWLKAPHIQSIPASFLEGSRKRDFGIGRPKIGWMNFAIFAGISYRVEGNSDEPNLESRAVKPEVENFHIFWPISQSPGQRDIAIPRGFMGNPKQCDKILISGFTLEALSPTHPQIPQNQGMVGCTRPGALCHGF